MEKDLQDHQAQSSQLSKKAEHAILLMPTARSVSSTYQYLPGNGPVFNYSARRTFQSAHNIPLVHIPPLSPPVTKFLSAAQNCGCCKGKTRGLQSKPSPQEGLLSIDKDGDSNTSEQPPYGSVRQTQLHHIPPLPLPDVTAWWPQCFGISIIKKHSLQFFRAHLPNRLFKRTQISKI